MNRQFNNTRAFTLMEILIAILIFFIVISTLFSSFNAFIISSEKVKQAVAHSEKIRTVFKRISLDLESIYVLQPPRYRKPEFNSDPDPYRFEGEEVTLGQGVVSQMRFPSYAHTGFGSDQRTGVARIVYYVKENKDKQYDLYRADSLAPFPEEQESCSDPVLCTDISGFEVVYRDREGEAYKSWNSEDEAVDYTFPASIDFKITFGTGEANQVFEVSIALVSGRDPIE